MALSACGGSSEEQERTISVSQLLDGNLVGPSTGSAQYVMEPFIKAGGTALNQRCGVLYRGLSGTAGGAVFVDVVFEVRESQLPLAIAARFQPVYTIDQFKETEKAELTVYKELGISVYEDNNVLFASEPFDCASRGL